MEQVISHVNPSDSHEHRFAQMMLELQRQHPDKELSARHYSYSSKQGTVIEIFYESNIVNPEHLLNRWWWWDEYWADKIDSFDSDITERNVFIADALNQLELLLDYPIDAKLRVQVEALIDRISKY